MGRTSRRDGLTGLLDDGGLHQALAGAIAHAASEGENVGLLFMDLDRFKQVNDALGHVTGSRILSRVAGLIDDLARSSAGVASRYGGDEFVVVLPGADLDRCLREGERLRAALAATIFAGGEPFGQAQRVRLTCSVGVASLRPKLGGETEAEHRDSAGAGPEGRDHAATRLLQCADDAMYRAKRAGRNRVAAAGGRAAGVA